MVNLKTTAVVVGLLLVAGCGTVAGAQAPVGRTEPPTNSTIPVLTPISILDLTAVTRPPSSGFEYALEQSRWEEADWEIIRLIVQCESGGDTMAVGALGEIGLLQIHPVNLPLVGDVDLFDPLSNLNAGFEVYEEQGWRAWAHCSRGAR